MNEENVIKQATPLDNFSKVHKIRRWQELTHILENNPTPLQILNCHMSISTILYYEEFDNLDFEIWRKDTLHKITEELRFDLNKELEKARLENLIFFCNNGYYPE